VEHVEAYALSADFLMDEIFPRYPAVFQEIKDQSKYRYSSNANEIYKQKHVHIQAVNMKSTFGMLHVNRKTMQK
jgi:hypothetical protein